MLTSDAKAKEARARMASTFRVSFMVSPVFWANHFGGLHKGCTRRRVVPYHLPSSLKYCGLHRFFWWFLAKVSNPRRDPGRCFWPTDRVEGIGIRLHSG